MPMNGEINTQFGVYKSICCGAEIVITEGSTFPDCPKHPRLTTQWKPTADVEPIRHVAELFPKTQSKPKTEMRKKDPAA